MEMEIVMEEGEDFMSENTTIENEEDISQLCRICANSNEYLIPIFRGEGLEHELKDKISIYLSIKVLETDKLPTQLCYQCASTLIAWHDLVSGCVEADKKLNALFQNMNPSESEAGVGERSKTVYLTENNTVRGSPSSASKRIETNIKSEEGITNHLMGSGNEDETEKIVVFEEEVTTMEPDIEEEVSSDLRCFSGISAYKPILGGDDDNNLPKSRLNRICQRKSNQIKRSSKSLKNKSRRSRRNSARKRSFQEEYICRLCDFVCQEKNKMTAHRRKRHSVFSLQCRTGMETRIELSGQNSVSTNDTKPFSCDLCECSYETNSYLQRHIIVKHGEEKLPSDCVILVDTVNIDVIDEAKQEINGTIIYHCNECGKNLFTKNGYVRHLRAHSGEKPFNCHVCEKKFSGVNDLKRHITVVHDKVKNVKCDICDLTFPDASRRDNHRRTHTGERPYLCHTCGKLFPSLTSIYIHRRIHTNYYPYHCIHCSKKFRTRQHLENHIRIHTGEKPFACETCGKTFRVKDKLARHKFTHSTEKPHLCPKCGQRFAQKHYLKLHNKIRHPTPSE